MKLTWDIKRNIDTLLPLILAALVGLIYFRRARNRSWQTLLAIMLITFIVLYAIISQVTKAIFTAAPHAVQLPSDVSLTSCGNYDPKPLIDAVKADAYRPWYSVGTRDIESYQRLASIDNCSFVKCYNYWNSTYYKENQETLPQAIAAESSFLDSAFGSVQETLAKKFAALNLS